MGNKLAYKIHYTGCKYFGVKAKDYDHTLILAEPPTDEVLDSVWALLHPVMTYETRTIEEPFIYND